MTSNEIQKLINFIASSGLDEVSIETENFKIAVKRYSATAAVVSHGTANQSFAAPLPPQPIVSYHTDTHVSEAGRSTDTPNAASQPAQSSNQQIIRSPMIGTFYRSASPDSPMFVEAGSEIKPGQPLCIIEAMKLFNEIESEMSGRIVKILVENATPVEYDQPLFVVEI